MLLVVVVWSRHDDRGAEVSAQGFNAPTEPIIREVVVPETITVGDLAHRMAIKAAEGLPATEEQDDKDWDRDEVRTEAKLEINRIIWQYGRPTMTLREAERLAVEFWSKLMEDRNV